MERVGFQGVALVFSCDVRESTRSCQIDSQRHKQHQDCGDARLNVYVVEEQPVKRFVNDVERGKEQERGLNECGEIFKLAVAVGMPFIRWLIRDAHGKKGDDSREQVQAGVQGLG